MNLVLSKPRSLTNAQFDQLSAMPPEEQWLRNLVNPYKTDVREFIAFTGLKDYAALRSVARSHVIAWRKDMEQRELSATSIRRKLSAQSSLYDYLCDQNAVHGKHWCSP